MTNPKAGRREFKRYTFRIYNFNAKTRMVEMVQTLKTKPMDKKDLERVMREELSKPYNKNACIELVSKT